MGDLLECVKLESVYLEGNRIESIEALQSLTALPRLRALYLQNMAKTLTNPICRTANYVESVQKLLPNLAVLDGQRVRAQPWQQLTQAMATADQVAEQKVESPASSQSVSLDIIDIPSPPGTLSGDQLDQQVMKILGPSASAILSNLEESRRLILQCDQLTGS
eukprot:TRINITY_DN2125_c0_g3_i2.p1 TRINITY_DN2125_c0_g3~~TRINITY_DN2125_c0_g3_i2.p1  ORF type:complete len:173 (-),score=13.72 TRINITY_DN2125_c0_g3_i2:38-526(-)